MENLGTEDAGAGREAEEGAREVAGRAFGDGTVGGVLQGPLDGSCG